MRALFFCLLVANLAVFGWFMVFDESVPPDQPPQPGSGSLELLGGGPAVDTACITRGDCQQTGV